MKEFLTTTKAVTIPRGLYIYFAKTFRQSFKEATGQEFDGEITDCEIATAMYGVIMEREERGGRNPDEMEQTLDCWTKFGDLTPEQIRDKIREIEKQMRDKEECDK